MSDSKRVQGKQNGWNLLLWIQAPFLFALWLLLSGKFDFFHVGSGVLAVLFVIWLDRKLGPVNVDSQGDRPVQAHPIRILLYIPWLAGQMVLSAWQVARVILSPKMPMNPGVVRFESPQPHNIARVVLGNSITLTPGTLTLDIQGDEYLVHSLTDASTEGLQEGGMQRRVARLFRADDLGTVSRVERLQGNIRREIQG